MTRAEFEEMTFEEVMEYLCDNCDEVTTIDTLKDFIKENVDAENFFLVSHLSDAIWHDPNPNDSDWYLYEYGMGTLDKPVSVSCKEDVEHLIDFEEDE